MSVTKLKLMNISGSLSQFTPVLYMCVNDPHIHIEDASSVIRDYKEFKEQTFSDESNPYKDLVSDMESLAQVVNIDLSEKFNAYANTAGQNTETAAAGTVTLDEIEKELDVDIREAQYLIKTSADKLRTHKEEINAANNIIMENQRIIGQLEHIGEISANLDALFNFEFFKFRFGHMPRGAYDFITLYGMTDMDDVFFIPSHIGKTEVWGIYITPRTKSAKADSMFSLQHFERVRISDKAHGTPEKAKAALAKEIAGVQNIIEELNAELADITKETNKLLDRYYEKIYMLFNIYELRKKAVRSKWSFSMAVWIPEEFVGNLSKQLEPLSMVVSPVNSPSDVPYVEPPTLLKNFPAVRPFEQFVKMYGLPSYGEIDPTPFLALTYLLFFGIMFADLGQGLVVSLGGFLLWRFKRINLGRIAGILGLSSAVFGFIFGSVFGLENVINGYKVMDHMNTILFAAIALGIVSLSAAIIINIVNGIKQKNIEKALFSQNGLAGLIFYLSAVTVVLVMMKFAPVNISLTVIIFIIALCVAVIYLKEPLANLIERKPKIIPNNAVEFFIANLFELFESVLGFMTNTISFIRIGGFALGHVGMMGVVVLLSETSSTFGIPILIIGNIIVMALEGLIVGIQCLRLEYYEIFGKFYDGGGKNFEPSKFAEKKYKNKRGL